MLSRDPPLNRNPMEILASQPAVAMQCAQTRPEMSAVGWMQPRQDVRSVGGCVHIKDSIVEAAERTEAEVAADSPELVTLKAVAADAEAACWPEVQVQLGKHWC